MTRLLAVLLLVSCGGNTPTPVRPSPRPDGGAAVAVGGNTAHAVSDALTEQDCDALIAHAVTVQLAERPADQQIGEAEQQTIRADLRPQFLPECRAMKRATYDCSIAATSTAAIDACR